MMLKELTFEKMKDLQVLLYIVGKTPIPDTIHVLKILYQADKMHLEEFGQTITNEQYVAMEFGPVASRMYNLIKSVRDAYPLVSSTITGSLSMNGNTIIPLADADTDFISQSERECLDSAIAELGSLNFDDVSQQSHDKAYQAAIERGGKNSDIELTDIVSMLINSEILAQHIADPNPGSVGVHNSI